MIIKKTFSGLITQKTYYRAVLPPSQMRIIVIMTMIIITMIMMIVIIITFEDVQNNRSLFNVGWPVSEYFDCGGGDDDASI